MTSYVRLGNEAAQDAYKVEVSPYDPELESKWADALEKGTVGYAEGEDELSNEVKAARLSAINYFRPITGRQVTTFIPGNTDLLAMFSEISAHIQIHFEGGGVPSWVESDSIALAALIAEQYGCQIGMPEGWLE